MSPDREIRGEHFKRALRVLSEMEEAGYQARFVGGCVRDRLMGINANDFDMATNALPDEVQHIFAKKPFKVIPTGISHGTVTVVYQLCSFEITTLRTDEKTDGRRAEVAFSDDFSVDASRRDFTINAMYEDQQGNIFDYFNGKSDLKNLIIRFVGDPETRIREDYLRILRYYRFKGRFGLKGVPGVSTVIKDNISGLANVAQERITQEILQILSGPCPGDCLREMAETGVAVASGLLSREVASGKKATDQILEFSENLTGKLEPSFMAYARLTGFYLVSLKLTEKMEAATTDNFQSWLRGFRLSSRQEKLMVQALSSLQKIAFAAPPEDEAAKLGIVNECEASGGEGSFPGFYAPLWQVVAELFEDPAKIKGIVADILSAEYSPSSRRKLKVPVDGKMIKSWTGIQEGKKVGQILNTLKKSFLNHHWNTPEEARRIADRLVREKLNS